MSEGIAYYIGTFGLGSLLFVMVFDQLYDQLSGGKSVCTPERGNGIICFNCHSSQDSRCGDNFRIDASDIDSRFECPVGSCFKRRGTRSSGDGEVRRTEVGRGCMTRRKDGCFSEKYNGIDQYTCVCNSNFCNRSSVSRAPIYFVLFFVFVTLLSFKYY